MLVRMDDRGPALLLGSAAEAFRAVALTNADGTHAVLIREAERPRALLTVGTEARAGRVVVTPLDEGVELRSDREAAARWIAGGSVVSPRAPSPAQAVERGPVRVPAWANVIGLALVLLIFGLTILGALTAIAWLAGLLRG